MTESRRPTPEERRALARRAKVFIAVALLLAVAFVAAAVALTVVWF